MVQSDSDYKVNTDSNSFHALFRKRNVAEHAWHIIPYLRLDAKIIDVGCGIGAISIDLARRCPAGHVIGVDNNAHDIALAKAAASTEGVNNIEFHVADATDLSSFQAGRFDIVHCHQVCMHVKDPVRIVREMRRLARPGTGIVSTRDCVHTTYVGASDLMERQAAAVEKFFYPAIPGHSVDGEPRGRCNHIWVHEAGFEWSKIDMGTGSWGCSGAEGRKFWVAASKQMHVELVKKIGSATDAEQEQLRQDYDTWMNNGEGRFMALDAWVIGKM